MWQMVDDQPIPIPKPPRLFNDTLIGIEDTTTTTPPPPNPFLYQSALAENRGF